MNLRFGRARPHVLVGLGLAFVLLVIALPAGATPGGTDVVISQVYGGGGNTGAAYKNDFIELYNPTAAAIPLTGWSVQYASTTGTSWQKTDLSGSIPAHGYYLVQEAQGAGGSTDLPTPNATGTIPMAGGAGKVVLLDSTTLTTAGTSCPATRVDLVGYGTGTNCFEGVGPTPAPSNTTSVIRNGDGAIDTDNNASDFTAGAPNPRNTPPTAASLSVSDVSQSEGNTGTTTFTFTVSLSAPAPATGVTFDVATADGTAIAPGDYATTSVAGHTIPQGGTSYAFDVAVNGDTDVEADETFLVNVTSVTGATVGDGQGQGTIQNDDATVDPCVRQFTPAYAIQGSGSSAAVTGDVTTQGVVVGDFEGSAANSGFFLQDQSGDGNPATSDGIFVFTGNQNLVDVGDVVRVTGFARERFEQTAINGSDSNGAAVPAGNIVECSTGNALPAATDVTLPFDSATSPERYEGMRVRFPQSLVIAEYFNYDRFGEIVLANPLPGEPRPFTGTAIDLPGAAANARTAANNLSRITLDDNQSAQNPAFLRHPNGGQFTLANLFRGGDQVQNTVGVLGFDFSLYRIYPTGAADYTSTNPRPAAPEPVGGSLRVAAMNTLNFFVTADYPTGNPLDNKCGPAQNVECRGWDFDQSTEFDRQRTKLLAALTGLNGDVIGLNELENTTGTEPLDSIVSGLPGYDYVHTGTIGTDAIKVGLVYRPSVVTPVGPYKLLTSAVDPRFIDTKSRPSLAQTFDVNATGARFTVVVNHLKSKGSDCVDVGDPDLGDGQGNCSQTRRKAADALVDWLATDPTGSGDPDFLIVGDLNSYAREQTLDEIKAGSDDTAGTGDDFTNLIAKYHGPFAYSYTFDGQAGYLDHALAGASLAGQVTGAADWHINSDEPDVLDYDTSFKPAAQDALYEPNQYRTSDHDAVVIGLNPNAAPHVDAGGPYVVDEGSSAQVCANATDGNGDTLTYAWDLDGNGSFETAGKCATYHAAANSAPAQATIAVKATDPGGLADTDSATVKIVWRFTGFVGLAESPAVNTVKAGKTVKLRFSLGGDQGLGILALNYPATAAHACGAPGPTDAGEPAASGKKGLSYDAKKGLYTFAWQTAKTMKNTCRTFVLKLADGTYHYAEFRLT
jgi:predicted extracellular nuclease